MDHLCYSSLVFVMLSRLFILPYGHLLGRADFLALVCDDLLCFCNFPMWYPGSGVLLNCIDS